MARAIAFLRAINVGGHVVTMDALKAHFRDAGCAGVESFIASGNIVFDSKAKDTVALERKIEKQLEKALGYEVKTFIRSDAEVAAIAAYEPFPKVLREKARAFSVGFLAAPMTAAEQKTLQSLASGVDHFHAHGRELYWLSLVAQSDSKFSNVLFERSLKLRTTFRGLNTIIRLTAKYPPTAK